MSNIEIVKSFFSHWEHRDLDKIVAALAADAIYHNIPMAPIDGRDNIRAALAPFIAGASEITWTVHAIAESASGVVLTERTDVFVMSGRPVSIRVMGAFELRDGLISRWRDYFDLAEFQSQMA